MPKRDRDANRKWESGSQKKKRKVAMLKENEKLSKSINKFLKPKDCDSSANKSEKNESSACCSVKESSEVTTKISAGFSREEKRNVDEPSTAPSSTGDQNESLDQINLHEKIEYISVSLDPADWASITDKERCYLVETGPFKTNSEDKDYPKDDQERHFSNFYYERTINCHEKQKRKWLIYSKKLNRVYCFCCKLFGNCRTQLSSDGCYDWRNLGKVLKRHENTSDHLKSMMKWFELEGRLRSGKTIDQENEALIRQAKKHWHDLIIRLVDIINFLAKHNLAFRGHRESFSSSEGLDLKNNSGNFMDIFKLIAKYDVTLSEHLRRINDKEIRDHYLSPEIQNELITLMSEEVIGVITKQIKSSKYYAFMLDCTKDAGRVEQMTVIFRFCNCETGLIEEHFVGFLDVNETNAANLTNVFLQKLKDLNLDISLCRGQGFDNGSNMIGIHSGVKTRILEINPRAFFTPCGCHNWNLLIVDASKSSPAASSFFGFIQRIYTLFSRSSKRWTDIKEKLNLHLKSLSETRWESRISAIKAILLQFDEVVKCIEKLRSDNITDSDIVSDCDSVLREMMTFDFILMLHIWYEQLFRVNVISKLWQSPEIHIGAALEHLEKFCLWAEEFRETGFNTMIEKAKEFANNSEYDISLEFKRKRITRKKKLFDYECEDNPIEEGEDRFRIEVFNKMLDSIISSTKTRFIGLQEHFKLFGFLYGIKQLKDISENNLREKCENLAKALTDRSTNKSDIDGCELLEEIEVFKEVIPSEINDTPKLLQYIVSNNLNQIYPNLYIVLRICCTIPVSTATAEKSFSTLKLIKTYLRTSMSQERLTGLAVLSIESRIAAELDYNEIIQQFSSKKSRQRYF